MDWFLGRKLSQLGTRANPEPCFVSTLEKTLKLQSGHRAWWIHWGRFAASATSVLFVAATATSAYAYTSDEVLPGTLLYPVRESMETVEMTIAQTPAVKAKTQVKQLRRHVHEAELLAARHKVISPQVEQRLNEKIDQATEQAKKLPAVEQDEIIKTLHRIKEKHADVLQGTATTTRDVRFELHAVDTKMRQIEHAQKRELKQTIRNNNKEK